MASTGGPLHDVRIISVEQFGAGPLATLYLADMGADVIKIEDASTGGDVGRYVPPGIDRGTSLYFEAFNRGKRSIALDLHSDAGREVFHRLVAECDVVFSNLRGDLPGRLGLTYDQLKERNPAVVCVALTGYGRSGPRAMLPAYDALVQAEAGWAALTGDPDGPPTKSGLSLADYVVGLSAALATMVALHDARRTGMGRDVDVTLLDAALAMLTYPATWYLSAGHRTERHPMSSHPSIVPFQFFRTADGHVAVACPKEKFFTRLAEQLGRPEWTADDRFADFESRRQHRTELTDLLDAEFAKRTTGEWLELLTGEVPIAPVQSLDEALERDFLRERSMLVEYEHPTLGAVASVGIPIRLDGFEPMPRPGPLLGQDRDQILRDLGADEREIASLAERGAFGSASLDGPDR